MRLIKFSIYTTLLLLTFQVTVSAQSFNVTETLKQHFNETVQEVKQTDTADEKRLLLNDSFDKMIQSLEQISAEANLSDDDLAKLNTLKSNIEEKKNELNGLDGFDEVGDEDLDEFSDYSQQHMEQANRTITISLTSALLIVILIILLF